MSLSSENVSMKRGEKFPKANPSAPHVNHDPHFVEKYGVKRKENELQFYKFVFPLFPLPTILLDESKTKRKEIFLTIFQMVSKNKVVSFASTGRVRLTRHINDYTREEIRACFYCADEIHAIKLDVKKTAMMIQNNRPIDEVDTCRRGAECRTTEATKVKSQNKKRAIVAVLNTQRYLKESVEADQAGDDEIANRLADMEEISTQYQVHTQHCRIAAYLVAISDQKVAESLQLDDNQVKFANDRDLGSHIRLEKKHLSQRSTRVCSAA